MPFILNDIHHRPHFGINGKTPFARIASNNLSRHDMTQLALIIQGDTEVIATRSFAVAPALP